MTTKNARRISRRALCLFQPRKQELFTDTLTSLRGLHQFHWHGCVPSVTYDLDVNSFADLMLVQDDEEFVVVADLLAVNRNDDVAKLDIAIFSLNQTAQARVGRCSPRLHGHNQHAVRDWQSHLARERFDIARLNAQLRPLHVTIAHELGHDALGNVDGNGKADSGGRARRRFDLRIDADHAAMRIQQRPAGISRIDRGVSLNRAFNLPPILRPNGSLQATDYSRGQRAIKSERISDRQNFLAYHKFVRIAQRHDRHLFPRRLQQSNNGQVGVWIATDHFGGIVFAAAKTYRQLLGIGDDVKIRKDVALLVDDRTRAGAFDWLRKQTKEIAHRGRRLNVNDAGRNRLVNLNIVLFVRSQRCIFYERCGYHRESRSERLKMICDLLKRHHAHHGKQRRGQGNDQDLACRYFVHNDFVLLRFQSAATKMR